MAGKTLRVLARGRAMVPDFAHFARVAHDSTVRFIGREWDASLGDGTTTSGGWRPLKEPTEISQDANRQAFNEYIHVLRTGGLWPADEATARMASCKFDASFGGEYAADAPKGE